jgi:ATP-binding cassette subfamily C protein
VIGAARRALQFLTPHERRVYVAFVTARSLLGLLDVLGIGLIGLIASVAATQFGGSGTGPAKIAGITLPTFDETGIVILVVVVLAVFVGKALIALLLTRRMVHFIARIETRISRAIADFIMRGSLGSMKNYSKAQLQYAVTTSTAGLFNGVLNNVATMFSEGFLLLVVVASFFLVNPVAAVFTLVFFGIIVVVIQFVIGGTIRRAGTNSAAGMVGTTNAMSDSLDAFREISVLSKQDAFVDRIAESRGRLSGAGATFAFLGGMPRYVVETSLILGVVVFVGQQFLAGELASGLVTIGVFLTGGVRIMASLLPLQAAATGIKHHDYEGALAAELLESKRVAEALEPAVLETEAEPTSPVPAGPLEVEISQATFRYPGDQKDTLHGVSASFAAGSYVAIIGPSGAGKTTLVDLVLGLIEPTSGRVTIGGVDPVTLRSLASGRVSYVPQKPGLVSGTIAENIALGVPPAGIDRSRLSRAIEDAYLADFIATLPDGADTSVGAQVDSLSGGQIQRIGLARALYTDPSLLILDEATSGLDAGSEAFIAETLLKLHGRVTVVVIAHRLSTVQHADVVHFIRDGRIAASGDFRTLRKTQPMVAEYVKLMSFEAE